MPISTLIHAEQDLLIEDTKAYVKQMSEIRPILLTLSATQAYICPEGTTEGKFIVGENVKDTCKQVRQYVSQLVQPLLN